MSFPRVRRFDRVPEKRGDFTPVNGKKSTDTGARRIILVARFIRVSMIGRESADISPVPPSDDRWVSARVMSLMGMDRHRLDLRGFLDPPAAGQLLQRILEIAGDRIGIVVLECAELEGWTFEALDIIDRRLRQADSLPPAFRIEFTTPPPGLALQGQLLGWSAVRGNAVFETDRPGPGSRRRGMLLCPQCENQFASPGPGNHACPHCHARFSVSGEHPPTFYESFGDEDFKEN